MIIFGVCFVLYLIKLSAGKGVSIRNEILIHHNFSIKLGLKLNPDSFFLGADYTLLGNQRMLKQQQ